MSFEDKDLQSIQEARILVETARVAQQTLKEYQQTYLNHLVSSLINSFNQESEMIIRSISESIGCGNPEDEQKLYHQFMAHFEKDYKEQSYVGSLSFDETGCPSRIGIPLGVIGVKLPVTNLVLNLMYSTLICLKTGNAMVVIPDTNAVEETNYLVHLINGLIIKNNGPSDVLGCMQTVSSLGVAELCHHQSLALLINIGGEEFAEVISEGKTPYLFGGVGSSPVFIERTALIDRACEKIINSRSFNNGLLPGAEQYVIVESSISEAVKKSLQREGAYFMSQEEETLLLELLFPDEGELAVNCIGKSAENLAVKAGFNIPKNTKVLVSEQPYINDENPYAEDLPIPLLTYYLEPSWIRACEKCIDLIEYKKNGHTLVIHSENKEVITEFILKKPVGRIIVNGLGGLNSIGIDSNLPTSMILGGLTTSKGFSAENITPRHLTYQRSVAHPINQKNSYETPIKSNHVDGLEELNAFAELLKEIIN